MFELVNFCIRWGAEFAPKQLQTVKWGTAQQRNRNNFCQKDPGKNKLPVEELVQDDQRNSVQTQR